MREKKRKQFTRMNQFFLENGIYFLPLYIIICCILLSIDPSIKWTREELKDSISIQWAIFGLSTTIYILLQAFVLKYISDKTPEKKASSAEYTIEKIIFRLCINDKIVPVIFLIANLALIIMATSSVYIIGGKVTLYMQTISIISFYLCTNTLISLFLHIIFPVFDKKIEAMKKTNITQEELVSLNQRIKFALIRDKLNKILDEIFSSNIQMNESEKEKVKSLLLEGLIREMINGEDASKDKDEDISQ